MVEKIYLKELYENCKDGYLRLYFPEYIPGVSTSRHTVVVCPGGGYEHTSQREGEIVALKLCSMGFNAAVLNYTVGVGCYPYPINELECVLDYLENKKNELGIKSLSVMGFSAGGHLAGYVGYTTKHKLHSVILGYPVITMDEYTHLGSKDHLLNGNNDLFEEMSVQNKVTKDSPRTFIYTTVDDGSVPFENTLSLVNALRKNNVSFELHAFEQGVHGLSLANELVATNQNQINEVVSSWTYFLEKFINRK